MRDDPNRGIKNEETAGSEQADLHNGELERAVDQQLVSLVDEYSWNSPEKMDYRHFPNFGRIHFRYLRKKEVPNRWRQLHSGGSKSVPSPHKRVIGN